ncbi:MAG: hypothetical protein ABIJ34_01765 [archaeon]
MEKARYKCNKCGYDFTRNANVKMSKCPYCGKEGTIENKKGNDAEKLLMEEY